MESPQFKDPEIPTDSANFKPDEKLPEHLEGFKELADAVRENHMKNIVGEGVEKVVHSLSVVLGLTDAMALRGAALGVPSANDDHYELSA